MLAPEPGDDQQPFFIGGLSRNLQQGWIQPQDLSRLEVDAVLAQVVSACAGWPRFWRDRGRTQTPLRPQINIFLTRLSHHFSLHGALVLHQKRLDPVVVPALADPIGDRRRLSRHLKALAKGLAEALKQRSGQGPDGGVQLMNGGRIERGQAGIELRSCCCNGCSSLSRCS